VNDVAVINGKGGLVEEINLRTTVLRGEDGAVHIFPNGSIQSLFELDARVSYSVINVSVAYKEIPTMSFPCSVRSRKVERRGTVQVGDPGAI